MKKDSLKTRLAKLKSQSHGKRKAITFYPRPHVWTFLQKLIPKQPDGRAVKGGINEVLNEIVEEAMSTLGELPEEK